MTLKRRIPARQREQLIRARDIWRRMSDHASLRTGYVGIHDGRTLNLFIRGAQPENRLCMVGNDGSIVSGPFAPYATDDGIAWTIDLEPESIAQGTYEIMVAAGMERPRPLDSSVASPRTPHDTVRDGNGTFAASTTAHLSTPYGHTYVKITSRAGRPSVAALARHNDGTYEVCFESLPEAASLTAVERNSRRELTWVATLEGKTTIDVADLAVSEVVDGVWDLYVDGAGTRERLKIASSDLQMPFGVMKIPGFFAPGTSHGTRYKPYVTEDGSLTVRVSVEPVEGAA